MIGGFLARRLEGQTVTYLTTKERGEISDWAGPSDARVPFKAHYGQPHIKRFREVMADLSRHDPIPGWEAMTVRGLASAEIAARRTLISATATMLSRLNNIRFGRVPAAEMDIVWHCRAALSGADDAEVTSGILRAMPGVLCDSPDEGLRDLANALYSRSRIVGGIDEIDDDELRQALQ